MSISSDDTDEADPPCAICGEPSSLSIDLGTESPWHLCEEHMPDKWRAIFASAKQPLGPCVVCGSPGEVRQVDFTTATVKHYCRDHAPDEAVEILDDLEP
jgi:hypothetical protein